MKIFNMREWLENEIKDVERRMVNACRQGDARVATELRFKANDLRVKLDKLK